MYIQYITYPPRFTISTHVSYLFRSHLCADELLSNRLSPSFCCSKINILGTYANIAAARRAICDLILGKLLPLAPNGDTQCELVCVSVGMWTIGAIEMLISCLSSRVEVDEY